MRRLYHTIIKPGLPCGLLTVLAHLVVLSNLFAQNGIHNYANISLSGNVNLAISNSSNQLNNAATIDGLFNLNMDGDLNNTGQFNLNASTINLAGDWTNTGNVQQGTSTVTFDGNSAQLLDNNEAVFFRLSLNNASGVSLLSDAIVNNRLTFTTGSLTTGLNDTLILGDTAVIIGEANGQYVIGQLLASRVIDGSASSNFGGIGFQLDPQGQNLGRVNVLRTAGLGIAGQSFVLNGADPTKNGIDRIWRISSQNSPSANLQLQFDWLSDDDNGLLSFSQSRVWNQANPASNWLEVGNLADASSRSISSQFGGLAAFTVSNNENDLFFLPSTMNCRDSSAFLALNATVSPDPAIINNASVVPAGIDSIYLSPSVFTCADLGVNTVTLFIRDSVNVTTSCAANITILDSIPAMAVCQNLNVFVDSFGGTTLLASDLDNGSIDSCGIDSFYTIPSSLSCANVGTNQVQLVVRDVGLNTSTCTATVTVTDTFAIVAKCRSITVQADASGAAVVPGDEVGDSTFSPCGVQSYAVTPPAFDCNDAGINPINLVVTDFNGNSSSCNASVFVSVSGVAVNGHTKISQTEGNFSANLGKKNHFGISSDALGDFNGDGYPDLVVGTDGDDDGGKDKGAIYMLFLNSDRSVISHQKISATQGNFGGDINKNDRFGTSVAAIGDVDGNGTTDLAVGVPFHDEGDKEKGGVFVLLTAPDGTVQSEQKIADIALGGALRKKDFFGTTVSAIGDVDGDGIPDIAAGAPFHDIGGKDRGAVGILLLNNDGTLKSFNTISSNSFPAGTIDNKDLFGGGLGPIGDLDRDGVPDLAVGSVRDDDGGKNQNKGAVYLLFLNSDGTFHDHQKISEDSGGFTGAISKKDFFGNDITQISDFNHDGIQDLAIGAFEGNDGAKDQGIMWILTLNTDGTVQENHKISGTEGDFFGDLDKQDRFGSSVSLLDTSDCTITIAVGAKADDDGSRGINRGAMWIIEFGSDTGTARPEPTFASEPVFALNGSNKQESTSDETDLLDMKVSPNPGTGIFRLELKTMLEDELQIEVFDRLGNSFGSEYFNGNLRKSIAELNLRHLNQGVYLIKLTSGDSELIKKVVKIDD